MVLQRNRNEMNGSTILSSDNMTSRIDCIKIIGKFCLYKIERKVGCSMHYDIYIHISTVYMFMYFSIVKYKVSSFCEMFYKLNIYYI